MVTTGAGANYFFDEFFSHLVGGLRLGLTPVPTCADVQNGGAEAAQLPRADPGDPGQFPSVAGTASAMAVSVRSVKTQ